MKTQTESKYINGVISRVPYTEIEGERWKDIPEFDGYQISDFGRVRCSRDNRGNLTNNYRLIDQQLCKDDYYRVDMSKYKESPRKQYHRRINRLVAEAFIGPSPQPNMVVDHIDTDKHNNKATNLRWLTFEKNSTLAAEAGLYKTKPVKIVETGEIFRSIKDCADALKVSSSNISHYLGTRSNVAVKDLTFEYVNMDEYEKYKAKNDVTKQNDFLYPHQRQAIKKMFNGCLLNGGTGSGKSRTGIYYFFSKNGGSIENQIYIPMRPNPPDLYILTTAKKRNDKEWEGELTPYLLYPDPKTHITERYGNKVIIDSWQNIKKYVDVTGAQFIFDECKVNGKGVWAKSFLKIAKSNEWIILSATVADKWEDFETIFMAHGYFRNRSEFRINHLVYNQYNRNFPDVIGYKNETRLCRLRDRLIIPMDFDRHTTQIHEDIYCDYDIQKYRETMRKRWDPYKEEPVTQASSLCYVLRRIVSEDESRQSKLLELLEDHPRAIIFYNFNFELDILLSLGYIEGTVVAQYNGHQHDSLPDSDRWVYLVQYTSGCEAWNTIKTDTIIFYSQNYSYKMMIQAAGRIDRLTTPYTKLHYFHMKSRSGIDLAISRALSQKKKFNERKFAGFN